MHCGRLSAEKKPQRSLNTLASLRAAAWPPAWWWPGTARSGRGWSAGPCATGCRSAFAGFLPGRAELAALLASADVVIAPGPAETFGLAALEALACGTPVVVSAESALPEVVGRRPGPAWRARTSRAGVHAVLARPEAGPPGRGPGPRRTLRLGRAPCEGFLAVHRACVRTSRRTERQRAYDPVICRAGRLDHGRHGRPGAGGGLARVGRLLADSLDQPEMHNLATLGALAIDVERMQLPAAVALEPDVASVVVGINDTLRGDFDPERTGASIGRTVAALRAAARRC